MAGDAKTVNWRGWFLLALLLTPLAAFGWGVHQEDWHFALPGAAVFAVLMTYFVTRGRKAPRDPAYEARVAKAIAAAKAPRPSDPRTNRLDFVMSFIMVAPVAVGALMVRLYWPGFAALPKDDQRLYMMAGGLPVIALIILVWWQLRRKLRRTV